MEESLRICLLGLHFAPALGGSERRTERQAHQLQAMGHQVLVVTLRDQRQWPDSETRDGVAVLRVGGLYRRTGQLRIGRLAIWPAMLLVARALWQRRAEYDVIHVMQISPLAAVAALVGSLTRKPVILCLQSLRAGPALSDAAGRPHDPAVRRSRRDESGGLEVLRRSVLGGPLLERYLQRAPVVYQALSRRGAAYLAEKRIPAARIVHIAGGVDTVRFHPAPSLSDATPGERRDIGGRRDIVCVARFEHSKGVDVLLHAWARLNLLDGATSPDSARPRLLLIGEGRLQPQIEALAHQLAIQEAVAFLGVREDIPRMLQQCYAFVLPSRWEGMSNALLEAMACGLPCVATRVSGTEDVLVDGVNGLLVPPERPVALGAALARLLRDPDEAARLGCAARATIERTYALSAVVDQHIALYRRLTSGTRHAARLAPVRMGHP